MPYLECSPWHSYCMHCLLQPLVISIDKELIQDYKCNSLPSDCVSSCSLKPQSHTTSLVLAIHNQNFSESGLLREWPVYAEFCTLGMRFLHWVIAYMLTLVHQTFISPLRVCQPPPKALSANLHSTSPTRHNEATCLRHKTQSQSNGIYSMVQIQIF